MCYVFDPYVLCFFFTPLEDKRLNDLQKGLTAVVCIDMFSNFVTGVPREDVVGQDDKELKDEENLTNSEYENDGKMKKKKDKKKQKRKGNVNTFKKKDLKDLEDPMLHRDIVYIIKNYFKQEAWFDIAANGPILLYIFAYGKPSTEEEIEEVQLDVLFVTCMAFKTLRLYHVKEVTDAFRRLIDFLSDIFYLHRYFFVNLQSWVFASIKFLMTVHYFACGWIVISKIKEF